MGRAWSIEYEGGLYHVLSRGNERKDIFHDDRDCIMFLDIIGEMSGNYDVDIFAKDDRDLLVYLVWKICILSNEETGRLFGMTYSAISHILSSMRTRMQKDSALQIKYNNIYSLYKM